MEVARACEDLADQPRADGLAVSLDEPAVRTVGEGDLRDACDDQRVDESGQHGEREKGEQRGEELAAHQTIPEPVPMTRSISLIPMNGMTMPPSAVDEQVAAQDARRADCARKRTPRSASGISATMISALKMTAERIADSGSPGA